MKLALYLPRYLQAISLPLLRPKTQSFFLFFFTRQHHAAYPFCGTKFKAGPFHIRTPVSHRQAGAGLLAG